MNRAIDTARIQMGASLFDALRSLEASGLLIVIVEDASDAVAGILTDGDLRRAILKGASVGDRVDDHIQTHFTSVGPDAGRADVLDLMQSRRISQIPILDGQRRLVGLHTLHGVLGGDVRPNWAVVMAGGRGERLRPLTDDVPKPMIRVAGRPILERLVLHLVGFGIRRVFIAAHYLGDVIERHFEDGATFGCAIEYLRESKPLGTAGALSLLPQPSEPVIVLNGDLLTQFDVGAMLDAHGRGPNAITIGVSEYSHRVPFGVVETQAGHVLAIEEKPSHMWTINAGIYVLDPQVIRDVQPDAELPMTALIEGCLARGARVGAHAISNDWIDVGRRPELDRARGVRVSS